VGEDEAVGDQEWTEGQQRTYTGDDVSSGYAAWLSYAHVQEEASCLRQYPNVMPVSPEKSIL